MISIIIPNHGRDLTQVLFSIQNSIYKDYEIIIVDKGKERSVQRNIGIDRAKGEYLLFLDSDQSVSERLLSECIELIKYCNAIYIPEIIMTGGWFGRIRQFERQFYTGTAVDVVRFIRAKNCPRFDEQQHGTEDSDWDRRVSGIRMISYWPILHFDNIGFLDYCKKKAYYAKSMMRFIQCNPNDKLLNFKYRCWTIFIKNKKWKRLIKNPLLTLGIAFILFVRGVIYLCQK